ncbi:transcription factor SPN1 [Pancytospora epiphaga]|nr:transcription factor SPN1 [Pancytospora epiphaga]
MNKKQLILLYNTKKNKFYRPMVVNEKLEKKRRRGIVSDSDSSLLNTSQKVGQEVPIAHIVQDNNNDHVSAVTSATPKRRATAKARSRTVKNATKTEDTEKYAYDLINIMKDANRKDQKANKDGKPALHRLEVIDAITERIVRRDTQDACLKLGILHEIRTWMEPLPDKSLPSQKIKKSLLDALYNVRVSKYDLLSSEVGKIVHFYSRNFKEAKDVRKMARNLMSKWKTQIIREGFE